MTTTSEFIAAGITGNTFREITEKFGRPFTQIGDTDKEMVTYALGFAWYREREHLPVPAAYEKAMGLSIRAILDLFEDATDAEVAAAADFVSQPPTTTP